VRVNGSAVQSNVTAESKLLSEHKGDSLGRPTPSLLRFDSFDDTAAMSTAYLHPSNLAKTRVLSALSPTANGVALVPERGDLYFAAFDVPEPYDRVFLVDTYSIFAGLQELERLDQEERSQAGAYSRIASLLRSKLLDQITRLEVSRAHCHALKR
jgi:hypothetical protein